MIGRAAVKEPWIFAQIKEGMSKPSSTLIKEVVLEHFDQMISYYDRYGAIILMREVIEAFFSQKFYYED